MTITISRRPSFTTATTSKLLNNSVVLVVVFLLITVVWTVHEVTGTIATTTDGISTSVTSTSTGSSVPIFHTTGTGSNATSSSLFASNDPYRWRDQLIRGENSPTKRQLNVEYRSILVVRIVTGSDSDGSSIENEINNVLFYEGTQVTVQQQMKLCSGGRILLQPANDGVVSVQINHLGGNTKVEAWTMAAAERVMIDHFRSTDTTLGYKDQLRQQADHVLIILPESFPAQSFVANAEIGRPICVFSYAWIASMSAYMHEMGHNLYLRHAGRGSSQPYADITGYMGISSPEAYGPQKCYNAAQHWSLNFYESRRISLLTVDISSSPVVLQVAAFVDHEKIGTDFTVLVQVSANTYLQFNRAKSYNSGTNMMEDQIVVISDAGDKTVLIAGLDATSSVLRLSSVAIQVCSVNIGASESGVDFAVVAVASRDNGNMCSGAVLSSASAAATPPIIDTPSPSKMPTDPPIVTTSAPVVTPEPVPAPTTAPINSPTSSPVSAAPVSVPTIPVSVPTIPPTTYTPSTYQPTVPEDDVNDGYISSPHPTDEEEKDEEENDEDEDFNPVVIKTPIFVSSSSDEIDPDSSGGDIVRSSSKASSSSTSGRHPAMLPGLLVFAGVVIVTILVTVRRMAIRRHYVSKPIRTSDEDFDVVDCKSDRTNSTLLIQQDDMEVSTNGFFNKVKNLIPDYEIDLGGGCDSTATAKNRL